MSSICSGRSSTVPAPPARHPRLRWIAWTGTLPSAHSATAPASTPGEGDGLTDELGGGQVQRRLVDLAWRADLGQPAGTHHADLIGERQRLGLVVGDQQRGHALPGQHLGHRRPGAGPQPGVQRAERLVQQDQPRTRRQRPGQRHPLLLASGELVRPAAGVVRVEADELEQLGDPRFRPRAGPALAARQAEGDVLRHRQVREERPVLGDVAEPAPVWRHPDAVAADLPVTDEHRAGRGRFEAGDHPQQRRLAASGRPDDRGDAAVGDVEVDPVEHRHRAVGAVHPAHRQRAHRPAIRCDWTSRNHDTGIDSTIISSAYGAAAA